MNRLLSVFALGGAVLLAGCVAPTPKPNDPYYAPVLPRTPLPAAANNGSIYQAGFEQNLYSDRKAFRVGDIITITLNERTSASKNAGSQIQKNSNANIGLTSLFGGGVSVNNPNGGLNPLDAARLSLDAEYNASRDTKGDAKAGQSNSLSGSITVTVSEVLPNGILAIHYARTEQAEVVYSSQLGDGHVCIPLCVGLVALGAPVTVPAFLTPGLIVIAVAVAVHAIVLGWNGSLPRPLGLALAGAYGWFLVAGLA